MPLYEYRCQACGAQEERLQPVSAPERHDCPECEAAGGMARQLSVAAFALSGGGWYKEGYGGGKAESKGGGEAKPDAAAATPAKADKPAEAPAAPSKPAGGCGGGCACH